MPSAAVGRITQYAHVITLCIRSFTYADVSLTPKSSSSSLAAHSIGCLTMTESDRLIDDEWISSSRPFCPFPSAIHFLLFGEPFEWSIYNKNMRSLKTTKKSTFSSRLVVVDEKKPFAFKFAVFFWFILFCLECREKHDI